MNGAGMSPDTVSVLLKITLQWFIKLNIYAKIVKPKVFCSGNNIYKQDAIPRICEKHIKKKT